jgi:hypothetical protein
MPQPSDRETPAASRRAFKNAASPARDLHRELHHDILHRAADRRGSERAGWWFIVEYAPLRGARRPGNTRVARSASTERGFASVCHAAAPSTAPC